MNEHLKELMLQAGYAAPEIATRAQKLAELIVRECADISEVSFHNGSAGFLAIKNYFGVEE